MNPTELTPVELDVLCELDWMDAKPGLEDIRERLGEEVEFIVVSTFRMGWEYATRRWSEAT